MHLGRRLLGRRLFRGLGLPTRRLRALFRGRLCPLGLMLRRLASRADLGLEQALLCAAPALAIAPEVLRLLRLLGGHLVSGRHQHRGRRRVRGGNLVSTARVGLHPFLRSTGPCSSIERKGSRGRLQARGDRRGSGWAHRGQKELALLGAARLLHRLVLHGAARGLLVLRLPAILVHVLVLDGRRAAALLPHLLLPDIVVHAVSHESGVSKSVCSRVSERGAAADSRFESTHCGSGYGTGATPRHRSLGTSGSLFRQPLLACSGTRAPRTRQPRPPPVGPRAPQPSRPRPPSRRQEALPSGRPKAAPLPPPPRRPRRPPRSVATAGRTWADPRPPGKCGMVEVNERRYKHARLSVYEAKQPPGPSPGPPSAGS